MHCVPTSDSDEHYRLGGRIYINPQDPALWVDKRFGIGWTLNFGNRWSWLVLGLLLAPALLVPALLLRILIAHH
jgi:uncharacterized membrane protein